VRFSMGFVSEDEDGIVKITSLALVKRKRC
jgi:hypothetical protein